MIESEDWGPTEEKEAMELEDIRRAFKRRARGRLLKNVVVLVLLVLDEVEASFRISGANGRRVVRKKNGGVGDLRRSVYD